MATPPVKKDPAENAYWAVSIVDNLAKIGSTQSGLTATESAKRLAANGPNSYASKKAASPFVAFLGQFKSAIVLMLLGAAILSLVVGDFTNAVIILVIIFASALLSFSQEYRATGAVAKLLELIQSTVQVVRDGKPVDVPTEATVVGDVVVLGAGSIIPGDGVVLEANNLFVDQAALTGESFPAEKRATPSAANAEVNDRNNVLYAASHVVSGSGRMLILQTAAATQYGAVADRLAQRRPESEFEQGVRKFGHLLLEVTFLLTLFVFAVNVYLHRPPLDSFMFALALAVGLTPQLLPAIITVNLSHGAQRMAKLKVIVKRMNAIENFGSMNLLCSDKTGTLTQGIVQVQGAFDSSGKEAPDALRFARLNAKFQTGFANPIDLALSKLDASGDEGVEAMGEIPYDFNRKRLSVCLREKGNTILVTKGALDQVMAVCSTAKVNGATQPVAQVADAVHALFVKNSDQGLRVLGIATKTVPADGNHNDVKLESDMCFEGLLVLGDPLRAGIGDAILRLKTLGIRLKVITGDNHLAARHLGESLGLDRLEVIRGSEMRSLTEAALRVRVSKVDIFAEIEPNQKERLIVALRHAGNVVGYIGDGVNDGAALHSADVGISVANAVPVAKEAADFVMLESGLDVLVSAVEEGRRTFANTLKYVFMATSANFGNMFSMAGASLFLPFLPLLPKQVLLNNLLTDIPEVTIATDNVDEEQLALPRRWDVRFITRFMVVFGIFNSAADYATFGVLLALRAPAPEFRTAWFVENIISATIAVFVVRSRRPFYKSKPCRELILGTIAAIVVTIALPYTPLGRVLGFVPLPLRLFGAILVIVAVYLVTIELVKKKFYQVVK